MGNLLSLIAKCIDLRSPIYMRAIVLSQALSGESFQKLHILSNEFGLIVCLKRNSQQRISHDRPVIFDTAEITSQMKSGSQLRFIQGYELIKRRESIGHSYRSLEAAAKWARLIIHNIIAVHGIEPIYKLVERSLNAFAARKAPDHIYFKSLYLLLKQEGYPVLESWYAHLTKSEQAHVAQRLKKPAPENDANDPLCQQLCESLSDWMEQTTDFSQPRNK